MTESFIAYIDESGDEGFNFEKGSSCWLILSAAVFRTKDEPNEVQLVRTVRDDLGKDQSKSLHFRDLKHQQKAYYTQQIGKSRMRCISIAIHKKSIKEPATFQVRGRLYNYAARLLIERISWLCRDERRNNEGDGTAKMIFSHRRTTSYDAIREYTEKLKYRDTDIEWSVISPENVTAHVHDQRHGLWIADAVASSFYFGLEISRLGLTEGRYATEMRRVVWNRQKHYLGTGIKLWPKEAMSHLQLGDGDAHSWLNDVYNVSQ